MILPGLIVIQALGQWETMRPGTATEFRAIRAVNARVVWAAGKGGIVAHTTDRGSHWRVDTIPGAAGLFLIGIHAEDARRAWVAGTAFEGASLARIYSTRDGGATWQLQYETAEPGVFADGLAFWDAKHGIVFGDPIGGKAWLLTTSNGGGRWSRIAGPQVLSGEASFAASGTAIALLGKHYLWIATGGGAHARVLQSQDRGESWFTVETPASGNAAKGIFGLAIGEHGRIVAVGGDYRQRESSNENLLLSDDGGRSFRIGSSPGLVGVQYGVAHAGRNRFLSVGPGGSATSSDGGMTWMKLDGPGFNTVSCAKEICWAAGVQGRLAHLPLR